MRVCVCMRMCLCPFEVRIDDIPSRFLLSRADLQGLHWEVMLRGGEVVE